MKRVLAWFVACAVSGAGCSTKEDIIVETAADVEVTEQDLDRDPWALLPGGAVALVHLDAPALFRSQFGQRLKALADARTPVPPSAGFEPTRDLTAMHVGFYSMQGADFAAVATGTFNPQAIEAAADGTQQTPLGAPLVKATYAGRTMYVSRNVGFVVLTPKTVLLGNETGIRRALDRIEHGKIERDMPRWMEGLLQTPNAAIVAGVDLQGQPPVQAAVGQFMFLEGLQTARILGNFEPPGMNYAGTLTYADEATAQKAAASLLGVHQQLRSYSWFMQIAGIGNPIHKLEATPVGSETQFVLALEGRTVEWLINLLADRMGVTREPIRATTSAPVTPAPPATPATTAPPAAPAPAQ